MKKGCIGMSNNIPNIGKPAKRALEHVNITRLEQLTQLDEKSLLSLHGVGPKAVDLLKTAMEKENISMLNEPFHPFSTDFIVLGDLKCDNAPKKRVIRDYLILLWMKDDTQLLEVINENVTVHQISHETIEGIDNLVQTISTEEAIISLELSQLLTHGKEGAAHGVVTFQSGIQKHFAEFYVFESHKKDARIKSITRYVVE